jgi:hypothetical protein
VDDSLTASPPPVRAPRAGRLVFLAAAALLAAATLWAYLPVLDNGFVWDDGANLIAARSHWDRGLAGVAWAFTTPFFGHYQPLTWMSYQLDALLSGATPRGVHTTNLVLHLLASVLVGALAGWFARRSLDPLEARDRSARCATASLLSAGLFALHPIHVETVAWATERRDALSTVLVLAAVLLHLTTSPPDAAPSRYRGLVALLHALAALARAQMGLPFVLLALDVWPLGRAARTPAAGRPWRQLVAEKSLSFAVAAASAAAALWAQASSGALTSASEHGLLDRLVQAGYGFAFYPAALVFRPSWLPLYERPSPFDPFAARYLLPALAAVAAIVALALLRRRLPALTTAAGAYLLLVLPVAGLAQSGIQLVADRYAYLATIPLLLFVACVTARWLQGAARLPARIVAAISLLALLALAAAATHRQAKVWRDDESLWRHVLAHSGSCLADNNLGQILLARGESGPALLHLVRALERVPSYPRPWRAIVVILEAPWPAEAPPREWVAAILERAATHSPDPTRATYAAALAWLRAGETARARTKLRQVLAVEPGHEGARLALAGLDSAAPSSRPLTAPVSPARP